MATDEAAVKDAELRRELTEGYLRLGDVQGQPYGENPGDTEGAFASYEKALNIFENSPNDENDLTFLKTKATVYARMSQIMIRRETGSEKSVEYARRNLETREKIAADPANKEMKFEISEDYLDLARTFVYQNDRKAAKESFERGMKMLDEIIKDDPKNTEFSEFRFYNYTTVYGDALVKTGDFDGAIESYLKALEKSANYANDTESAKQLKKEAINRRLGDLYYFRAQKETGAARQKNFNSACDFYRRSLEFLLPENKFFEEATKYTNEKIAECAKTSGD